MSDEPLALSTIAPAPQAESDYDVICAAILGTARGRWFLDEYTRRNRNADTEQVLGALGRIETAIAGERAREARQTFRIELLEMARAIAQTRAEVTESTPAAVPPPDAEPQAGADAPDVVAAAERLQDVAWAMRERGLDDRTCEQVEALAATILSAASLRNPADPRAHKLAQVLHDLERRIDAMLEASAAPAMDTARPADARQQAHEVVAPDPAAHQPAPVEDPPEQEREAIASDPAAHEAALHADDASLQREEAVASGFVAGEAQNAGDAGGTPVFAIGTLAADNDGNDDGDAERDVSALAPAVTNDGDIDDGDSGAADNGGNAEGLIEPAPLAAERAGDAVAGAVEPEPNPKPNPEREPEMPALAGATDLAAAVIDAVPDGLAADAVTETPAAAAIPDAAAAPAGAQSGSEPKISPQTWLSAAEPESPTVAPTQDGPPPTWAMELEPPYVPVAPGPPALAQRIVPRPAPSMWDPPETQPNLRAAVQDIEPADFLLEPLSLPVRASSHGATLAQADAPAPAPPKRNTIMEIDTELFEAGASARMPPVMPAMPAMPMPVDPLAALNALSDEEKIAIFT